jgi:V-type H+-transporting ATPase proteolipid subunit
MRVFSGFMHLAAGLSVGLTGLAGGYAIGIVGDKVRSNSHSTKSSEC